MGSYFLGCSFLFLLDVICLIFLFFAGHACGMQKFLGQGSNLHHNSDNTASFFFLGLHLQHMEVPRLGVESELQLQAYATATATPDPSRTCDLYTLQLTVLPDP